MALFLFLLWTVPFQVLQCGEGGQGGAGVHMHLGAVL